MTQVIRYLLFLVTIFFTGQSWSVPATTNYSYDSISSDFCSNSYSYDSCLNFRYSGNESLNFDLRKKTLSASFFAFKVGFVATKGLGGVDDLLKAGTQADKNGLTKAGRALQKHGDRQGGVFPRSTGNASARPRSPRGDIKKPESDYWSESFWW